MPFFLVRWLHDCNLVCFCLPLLGVRQSAEGTPCPGNKVSCPPLTSSARGETSPSKGLCRRTRSQGCSSKEGYTDGRVSFRGIWEKLIAFSLLVHRWRQRVTWSISLKKTGLFCCQLSPPRPSPMPNRLRVFSFCCRLHICGTNRVFSEKRGQVQLLHTQSCLGREANAAASICLCTQGTVQGQRKTDSSVSLATLSLPPLQPLDSS